MINAWDWLDGEFNISSRMKQSVRLREAELVEKNNYFNNILIAVIWLFLVTTELTAILSAKAAA